MMEAIKVTLSQSYKVNGVETNIISFRPLVLKDIRKYQKRLMELASEAENDGAKPKKTADMSILFDLAIDLADWDEKYIENLNMADTSLVIEKISGIFENSMGEFGTGARPTP